MSDQDLIFAEHSWESRANGKMLLYFGPHLKETLSRESVRELVRRRKAWGAFWNYGWDCKGPWYAYVCDTSDYDIDKITSKNSRKTIRRSLERCDVRRIKPAWLADNGHETYLNATARYKHYKVSSREEFVRDMRALERVPGTLLYGVFVADALVAYGVAYELGRSVRFREALFDPEYSHAKPMYALYYTLANDCLNRGFTEIDAGWRPLVHETDIEEFFRRMGWRQAPCRLDLYLTWPLRLISFIARTFKQPLQFLCPVRYWLVLEGLMVAQDVAGQSRELPVEG